MEFVSVYQDVRSDAEGDRGLRTAQKKSDYLMITPRCYNSPSPLQAASLQKFSASNPVLLKSSQCSELLNQFLSPLKFFFFPKYTSLCYLCIFRGVVCHSKSVQSRGQLVEAGSPSTLGAMCSSLWQTLVFAESSPRSWVTPTRTQQHCVMS